MHDVLIYSTIIGIYVGIAAFCDILRLYQGDAAHGMKEDGRQNSCANVQPSITRHDDRVEYPLLLRPGVEVPLII